MYDCVKNQHFADLKKILGGNLLWHARTIMGGAVPANTVSLERHTPVATAPALPAPTMTAASRRTKAPVRILNPPPAEQTT